MHSASGSLQANPSWYSAGKRRSAAPAFPLPLNPGLYNPSYHRRLSASRQEDYYRGQDPDEAVDSTSPAATQEAEGRRPPALPPGVLYLLIVAVLWGSYSPALRYAFTLPGPPTAEVLTAVRGVLQVALLSVVNLLALPKGRAAGGGGRSDLSEPLLPGAGGGGEASRRLLSWLPALPLSLLGGLEIGLYNTIGTASQAWGLQYTTATRAAFLVQASSVFTPALVALSGRPPPPAAWAGSALALVGTVLVTLDETGAAGDAAAVAAAAAAGGAQPLLSWGDASVLLGALCYSAATVRIPAYRSVPPVRLALGKSATLAVVSVAVLAAEVGGLLLHGQPLAAALWPGWRDPAAWAVILWSAVGPGALAAYLHVKGQRSVSPTTAQVIFSSVPLWSVALAAAALHDERAGPLTWAGGAAVVAAGLVSALAKQ